MEICAMRGESLWECEECFWTTDDLYKARDHMRKGHAVVVRFIGEYPVPLGVVIGQCPLCGKQFSDKRIFLQHEYANAIEHSSSSGFYGHSKRCANMDTQEKRAWEREPAFAKFFRERGSRRSFSRR